MKTVPFTYGRVTERDDFTNRAAEIALLKRNFAAGVNTILISPRRWGKSSLLKIAAEETVLENPDIRICHIDIFNMRSEHEFYLGLANGILNAISSKWEEFVQHTKLFLSGLIPNVTFSPDKQTGVSFGVGWEEIQRNPDEILDLAEKIASRKKIKMIVCIDEFQSLTSFKEPLLFQKKLRSHWQNHSRVTYCLYGSKRHMLLDVFSNPSMPFYKFGELIYLKKINTEEWVSFIQKRFSDTGKQINESDAGLIALLADNHSYYVQQLAQQTWFRTKRVCNKTCIVSAREEITDQLSLLFATITERFSAKQLGLLHAILSGEEQLTSQSTLHKYRLGTSANVVRVKRGLIESEIIDDTGQELSFLDPIYKYWLETYFFKLKANNQTAESNINPAKKLIADR
ncbi:MAG: ATP-binding protein [Proteiniphilum sp.]|nr:ATP-binding protein [Proteiniphilum sp.]